MITTSTILLVEDNEDDEILTLRALEKNQIANEVVVAQLERLAALHRAGDLSLVEFQEAKAVVLANAKAPGR